MSSTSAQGAAPQMSHTLPPLPYSFDALEPYIDAKTMEIHHDKHHGAYVTNLNKALEGHADLQRLTVEELLAQIGKVPENIRTAVRNNGGGHMNHSMFWKIMKKGGGGEPSGELAVPSKKLSAPSPNSRRNSIRRRRRDLDRDGPGCCSGMASSQSSRRQTRTTQFWMEAKVSLAWTFGNTPTI